MLCRFDPSGSIRTLRIADLCGLEAQHVNIVWSNGCPAFPGRRIVIRGPQFNHGRCGCWSASDADRHGSATRQRSALADNRHLLDDIGLLCREALDEADRPFLALTACKEV